MDRLLTISLLLLVLLFSGCTRLDWLDEQAGKLFFESPETATNTPGRQDIASGTVKSVKELSEGLSKEIKQNIDEWLESEGLNRYGDPTDTYYTGGTPLFDEATGVATERYEYILFRIPGILEKIK